MAAKCDSLSCTAGSVAIVALETSKEHQFFRANVGIAVCNHRGQVLALERFPRDSKRWQMAQGGIDGKEQPIDAAHRELREEIGLERHQVELIVEHGEWLTYELPPHARSIPLGLGQTQRWFLFRLLAPAEAIDLEQDSRSTGGLPEFVSWRWTTLAALAERTWKPRQPIYRRLAKDWAGYLKHP